MKISAPFTKLETNIKGAPVSLDMSPFMCIVGSGRSGKTRFRDAFIVAMTGTHPSRSHASQLFEALAPPDAEEIYARLYSGPDESPDASAVFRAGPKVAGKTERRVSGWLAEISEEDVARSFPYDSAGAIFEYGKERTRRILFQRWGQLQRGVAVPHGLLDDDREIWNEAAEATRSQLSEGQGAEDHLVLMCKWFAREKKAGNAAANKSDEAESDEVEEAAGAEMLPGLLSQLAAAQTWERCEVLFNELDRYQRELQTLEVEAAQLEHTLATPLTLPIEPTAPSNVQAAAAQVQALKSRIALSDALLTMVKANADLGSRVCPLCECNTDMRIVAERGAKRVADRKSELARLEQRIQTEHSAYADARRDWASRADLATRERRSAENDLVARKARVAMHKASIARLQSETAKVTRYSGPAASLVQQQIDVIRSTLVAAETAQAHRLAARAARKRAQIAKDLETKAKRMLDTSVRKAIDDANAAVNVFTPHEIQIKINLEDYAWETVGEDGRPHDRWLMCGTERASTVIALASAWSQPLGVLWLDDDDLRGLDAQVMLHQFARLEQAVKEGKLNQVVVLSNRPHEMPAHWPTYVVKETR